MDLRNDNQTRNSAAGASGPSQVHLKCPAAACFNGSHGNAHDKIPESPIQSVLEGSPRSGAEVQGRQENHQNVLAVVKRRCGEVTPAAVQIAPVPKEPGFSFATKCPAGSGPARHKHPAGTHGCPSTAPAGTSTARVGRRPRSLSLPFQIAAVGVQFPGGQVPLPCRAKKAWAVPQPSAGLGGAGFSLPMRTGKNLKTAFSRSFAGRAVFSHLYALSSIYTLGKGSGKGSGNRADGRSTRQRHV